MKMLLKGRGQPFERVLTCFLIKGLTSACKIVLYINFCKLGFIDRKLISMGGSRV
jgi:hypothetical protein